MRSLDVALMLFLFVSSLGAAEPRAVDWSPRATVAVVNWSPAATSCDCPLSGVCACTTCPCPGAPAAVRSQPPLTRPAQDGGPDWTWNVQRQTWFRVLHEQSGVQSPLQAPAPGFMPRLTPLSFIGGGGMARGGSC